MELQSANEEGRERPLSGSPSVASGEVDHALSTPALCERSPKAHRKREKLIGFSPRTPRTPRDQQFSASESNIPARERYLKPKDHIQSKERSGHGDNSPSPRSSPKRRASYDKPPSAGAPSRPKASDKNLKPASPLHRSKKLGSCTTMETVDVPVSRQLREIQSEMRSGIRIIKDSRFRLQELQKKPSLNDADIKELGDRHDLLLREMERFDRVTRTLQRLVTTELASKRPKAKHQPRHNDMPSPFSKGYEGSPQHVDAQALSIDANSDATYNCDQNKSEIDLIRKLSESYNMQEKLVADNADLELKRYILYKELMTKDQNLEIYRSQIQRLQGELKLMSKENALLHKRFNSEGDATAVDPDLNAQPNKDSCPTKDGPDSQELVDKLESYKSSSQDLEKQLGGLEVEVRHVRVEMDQIKKAAAGVASAGPTPPACGLGHGPNTCFNQPAGGPPVPPMSKACGVCPPCPAPCNPNAPPTPAEREVARLTIQLKQLEENFKTKVTECALLRADLMQKKDELEKERCLHREAQNKLRELEMRVEGLTMHTNMMLGTKEQAFENETNVRALKMCYREAREEIDELRTLMKELNEQLQDYRVKYMQAQQMVEEQKRQMDLMDMDNTRISEQINLEIQRVKLKFQEKLQELAPIPELLKATQMRLKDAQQSQALAEHNAEQLARELSIARERIHALLHMAVKAPEKTPDSKPDEKQMSLLNQRITQLTETNVALKNEIERLKANVIRLEEAVLMNEKRLHEKMHECAQLGGELERIQMDSSRALARAQERQETIKKCLQTTIAELERQLATCRAQVKTAEREREEIQGRMACQIKRLNENFEQAQLRIMGLTTQVQALRQTASSGDGDQDPADLECLCRTMFDNA